MINTIGKSAKGHPIKLYSYGQANAPQVLLYGLPDPGEAVGASGLLGLLRALKDPHHLIHQMNVRWNFIPCLNIDDQPNDGLTLELVQKEQHQEVDWMIEQPRPETSALLNLNDLLNPVFTFPMHDEFHCEEVLPCYFPVSHELPDHICQEISTIIKHYGLSISPDIADDKMGQGFLDMFAINDIHKSTFAQFAKKGLVFICEVPRKEESQHKNLMATQLACAFLLINAIQLET